MTADTRATSVLLRDALAELDRLRLFAEQVAVLQEPEGMFRFRTTHDLVQAAYEALGGPA